MYATARRSSSSDGGWLTKSTASRRAASRILQHFVANKSAEALRAQVERSAIRDRDLDQNFIADWSALDQASWQQLETSEQQRKPATRDGEKSTSRRSIRR